MARLFGSQVLHENFMDSTLTPHDGVFPVSAGFDALVSYRRSGSRSRLQCRN